MYYQNTRGLNTKTDVFYNNLLINDYDIVLLTETWLGEGVSSDELFDDRYCVYRKDRDKIKSNKTRGGGVIIACRNNITSTEINIDLDETLLVRIKTEKTKWLNIVLIYIPPEKTCNYFREVFEEIELRLSGLSGNNMIIGDFNLSNIPWKNYFKMSDNGNALTNNYDITNLYDYCCDTARDSRINCLVDFMCRNNYYQINSTVNKYNKILDLVMINHKQITVGANKSENPFVDEDPYHPAIDIGLDYKVKTSSIKNNKNNSDNMMNNKSSVEKIAEGPDDYYFDFKNADFVKMIDNTINMVWDDLYMINNVDTAVEYFYTKIGNIFSDCVPLKKIQKKKKKYQRFPIWTSTETKMKIKRKNKLHKIFKKNKTNLNKNKHTDARNNARDGMKHDRIVYINEIERNINKNPKKYFEEFKKNLNNTEKNNSNQTEFIYNNISVNNDYEIAENFAKQFEKSYGDNNNYDINIPLINVTNNVNNTNSDKYKGFHFSEITKENIIDKINSLKPSFSNKNDGIPDIYLKSGCEWLLSPICFLYNLSIKTGTFPKKWKNILIRPRFKSGNRKLMENYRPIANIPTLSKILESICNDQINSYLTDIVTIHQHGFTKNKNTITNLIYTTSEITKGFSMKKQIDIIYLDFKKAFDRVDHGVLDDDLAKYNFDTNSRKWINSFLTKRELSVIFNNIHSSPFTNNTGLPQGSPLAGSLFLIKINEITEIIQNVKIVLFADDIKLLKIIDKDDDHCLMQRDIDRIYQWTIRNKMELNIKKCNIMTFYCRETFNNYEYVIQGEKLNRVSEIKDLGVIFQPDFTFKIHIDGIINKTNKLLGYLKRNTVYIKEEKNIIILFNTYIRTILEYASSIWEPANADVTHRIELIQNNFLRHLYNKSNRIKGTFDIKIYRSVSSLRKYYNVESLAYRRKVNDLVLLKKIYCDRKINNLLMDNIIIRDNIKSLRNVRPFGVNIRILSNKLLNSTMIRMTNLYNNLFSSLNPMLLNIKDYKKLCLKNIHELL